jgi:hypothetical protein
MSVEPVLAQAIPASPRSFVRVEYLDFDSVPDHREYRLAVCRPEGRTEFRFRIAFAAFGAGRVRIQDGPDVCYQKLLQAVASGAPAVSEVVTIDAVELASYREAHTPVPKRRAGGTFSLPVKPLAVARPPLRPRSPRVPVSPAVPDHEESPFAVGQRVRHSLFGLGVTTASSGGRTSVRFDEDGPRTFVTSLLQLDVLSAPHTWETGSRGKNKPRQTTLTPR